MHHGELCCPITYTTTTSFLYLRIRVARMITIITARPVVLALGVLGFRLPAPLLVTAASVRAPLISQHYRYRLLEHMLHRHLTYMVNCW